MYVREALPGRGLDRDNRERHFGTSQETGRASSTLCRLDKRTSHSLLSSPRIRGLCHRAAGAELAADWRQGSGSGLDQISERLNFGFARKLPVLRQTEAAECGLVCLAMVAWFFGLRTDPAAIRSRHATSNRGLTLANIMKMAAPLGLSARAVRLDIADLDKLRLPAVLHWNLDHFVVLRQVEQ
jgi:hypothetical protein